MPDREGERGLVRVVGLEVGRQLLDGGFIPACSIALASEAVEAVELLVDLTRELEGIGVGQRV